MLAPYGGIVEEMAVSVGERIEQGDLIAKLATTKEFAPVEGRVAGVFGQPGEALAARVLAAFEAEYGPEMRRQLEAFASENFDRA